MNKAIAILTLVAASTFIGGQAMAIEKPSYTVIGAVGDVEYRQYAPYVVAETRVSGDWSANAAGNEGFRRLVKYISGNNEAGGKIAMTAPVAQSRGEKLAMTAPVSQASADGDWAVTFVMPADRTLDTLPQPRDPRIELKLVPERTVAVLRYSGSWSQRRYLKEEQRLLSALDSMGIEPLTAPEFARYNAPFMPSFFRRNEIIVDVDKVPDSLAENQQVAFAR